MSVEVKRNCSSSVRVTDERVNFNSMTIVLTEKCAEIYHQLERDYPGLTEIDVFKRIVSMGLTVYGISIEFRKKTEGKE